MPKLSNTAFTDKFVSNLKPAEHRYDRFDAVVRGLGIRVSKSGKKSWFVMKRVDGRNRRITLGTYPQMTLSAARKRAIDTLEEIDEGRFESSKPVSLLVRDAFAEWMDIDQSANTSAPEVRRAMEKHVLPYLGDRPLHQVRRRDLLTILDKMRNAGLTAQTNRVRAYLRRMFSWCVARDLLDKSPANLVETGISEKSRDRVLTLEELRRIWNAADTLGYPFGPMYQLLLLTGQRRNEVAQARWPEFDIEQRIWQIPAERAKNDQPHLVHLSAAAHTLVSRLPRLSDSPFLFTTTGRRPVSGFSKSKNRIDEFSGVTGWRVHDLRRSFATHMTERLGENPAVIDKVLNHSSGAVTGIAAVYQKGQYLAQRKSAMDAWGGLVLSGN